MKCLFHYLSHIIVCVIGRIIQAQDAEISRLVLQARTRNVTADDCRPAGRRVF